jgi:hypothetical protein
MKLVRSVSCAALLIGLLAGVSAANAGSSSDALRGRLVGAGSSAEAAGAARGAGLGERETTAAFCSALSSLQAKGSSNYDAVYGAYADFRAGAATSPSELDGACTAAAGGGQRGALALSTERVRPRPPTRH